MLQPAYQMDCRSVGRLMLAVGFLLSMTLGISAENITCYECYFMTVDYEEGTSSSDCNDPFSGKAETCTVVDGACYKHKAWNDTGMFKLIFICRRHVVELVVGTIYFYLI